MPFRMRRATLSSLCLVLPAALLATAAPAQTPAVATEVDAVEILKRADNIRFPRTAFQVEVSVRSETPGRDAQLHQYKILSQSTDKTLVVTTEPASERGRVLLLKGRDLWVFMPNLSQPIRLSLAQRLTGQVANGDLARANFSEDYTPKLLRTESLEGGEHYVLELTAVERSVTYHRVLYWVDKTNYKPLKAEFYAVSGRLLKTCHYNNFITMEGEQRPALLVMEDTLRQGERSILEYRDMVAVDIPDKFFTKDYLKKFQ